MANFHRHGHGHGHSRKVGRRTTHYRKQQQQQQWPPVKLTADDNHVTVENGIVKVTWTLPRGDVAGISYGGINNLLEFRNAENERGTGILFGGHQRVLFGSKFSIIKQDQDEVEISFSSRWDPAGWNSSDHPSLPINMDKR
ncbi:hypothetical protein AKJ16_DCAP27075 [Drosera capensis]